MSPLLPTPINGYPGIGGFTVTCATRINASPETCLQVVLDTAKYSEWNPFVPYATITHQPSEETTPPTSTTLQKGTKFTFHVDMDVGTKTATPPLPKESLTKTEGLVVTFLGPVDETVEKDKEVNAVAEGIFADKAITGKRTSRLRVCWGFDPENRAYPHWLLRSERIQEFHLVETEDGRAVTDYVCWETFGGMLTPVMRLVVGAKVQNGVSAWMEGLKKAAEAIEGRGSAGQ
jgi:hypothetical protein